MGFSFDGRVSRIFTEALVLETSRRTLGRFKVCWIETGQGSGGVMLSGQERDASWVCCFHGERVPAGSTGPGLSSPRPSPGEAHLLRLPQVAGPGRLPTFGRVGVLVVEMVGLDFGNQGGLRRAGGQAQWPHRGSWPGEGRSSARGSEGRG